MVVRADTVYLVLKRCEMSVSKVMKVGWRRDRGEHGNNRHNRGIPSCQDRSKILIARVS